MGTEGLKFNPSVPFYFSFAYQYMFKFLCGPRIVDLQRYLGIAGLFFYFVLVEDYRFSLTWALIHPVIVISFSVIVVNSGLLDKFPGFTAYYCNRFRDVEPAKDEDEYYANKLEHMHSISKNHKNWLFLPTEDGFAAAPAFMFGINPLTAIVSGILFGIMHIRSYSLAECISKAIFYPVLCLLILPYGLLTLIVGHYLTDMLGYLILKATMKHVENKAEDLE